MQRHKEVYKNCLPSSVANGIGSGNQVIRQSHEKLTIGKQWQSAAHQKPADDKKTDWKWNPSNTFKSKHKSTNMQKPSSV
jgi:hypothetical protein